MATNNVPAADAAAIEAALLDPNLPFPSGYAIDPGATPPYRKLTAAELAALEPAPELKPATPAPAPAFVAAAARPKSDG